MTLVNPPNQSSLTFRIGTYQTFVDAMLARLAGQAIRDPDSGELVYPLARLTTRNASDLAIALLDAWAGVGDVATFYQERIANEGFLGTAQQTHSVVLSTEEIGYQFFPAVAASAPLAVTINPQASNEPVDIPAGTQVLSAPATGQAPQVFETVATFQARADWNALRPVQTRGQVLDGTSVSLEVTGNVGQFVAGQPLVFYDGASLVDFRLTQSVESGSSPGTVRLAWPKALSAAYHQPVVVTFQQQANVFGFNAPPWQDLPDAVRAQYGDTLPGAIACLAMAPDGQHIVTGQTDGTLILWTVDRSMSSSAPLSAGPAVAAHASVNSVAFSPDGTRIASAGSDGLLRIWDAQLSPLQVLNGTGGSINSVAFSPQFTSDHKLVSGGADRLVLLWSVDQERTLPSPDTLAR